MAESHWARRHAAALVKVLALAPGRRLHREQLLDLVWPDDPLDEAVPKLHKAAHFARRAIAVPSSVVLRGDSVMLCPGRRRRPSTSCGSRSSPAGPWPTRTPPPPARRSPSTAASCCPRDRYEPWAEERREQLRLRHLDLLRLDGRWDDGGRARRRRRASPTSRSCAGTPPTAIATPRCASSSAWTARCAASSGVAPEPRGAGPARPPPGRARRRAAAATTTLIGRDAELAVVEQALLDVADRAQPHADRRRPGRRGQVVARGGRHRRGPASSASASARARRPPVEGAWPYAPVVEALADVCRRHPTLLDGLPDHHREEIDRALAGAEIAWTGGSSHQRLFVAAAELVRLASATNGLLLTIDDVHDADDASLRLLHYIARSTHDHRVCIVLTHRPAPMTDDARPRPARACSTATAPSSSSSVRWPTTTSPPSSAATSPSRRPSWSTGSPPSAGASRSP